MLSTVMLLALTLVAAATDVLWKKIYNWNTYSGILAALAASAARDAWMAAGLGTEERLAYWLGSGPFLDSLSGLLACGALMVVCCLFFPDIGGGDVKLLAMIGTWLGWEKGMEALLWTFVLCACFSLVLLVWRIGPLTTASRVVRLLASRLRLLWLPPLSEEEREALRPPMFLAPSAVAAVIIVRFDLIEVLERIGT